MIKPNGVAHSQFEVSMHCEKMIAWSDETTTYTPQCDKCEEHHSEFFYSCTILNDEPCIMTEKIL